MSYEVFFDFAQGLAAPLKVPTGTKKRLLEHVLEIEGLLALKRSKYEDNPVHWDHFDENYKKGFPNVTDDDALCNAIQGHNEWVVRTYREFGEWSEKPVAEGEIITPDEAQEFWHGFQRLTVPLNRWSANYYRNRMEHLYEVMRGRPNEGNDFDEKPLTVRQAAQVINLFSEYLDTGDLRLDVPNGYDYLASSTDGGYDWCEKCGPVHPDAWTEERGCGKRKCPLKQPR